MKIYVFASKSRKDLGAWIEEHTFQVIVALAQLYAFHGGNRGHWRREVWSKFPEMHTFRHNNKLPDAKFILANSWDVNKKYVENALQYAIGKEYEYEPRTDISLDEFYSIAQQYFYWLAEYYTTHRAMIPKDCYSELDKLGLNE